MKFAYGSRDELLQSLVDRYSDLISDDEIAWSSYSLRALGLLLPALRRLRGLRISRMLDVGCGYGVLTGIMADYIGVEEAWGIDADPERLKHARKNLGHKLKLHQGNFLNSTGLPEHYFDLVTCFGVLEHIHEWDSFYDRLHEVVRQDSHFLLSVPNLGSWVNRLSLLVGYQPRDLEISKRKLYGSLHSDTVASHVKLATLRALKEYMQDHGYDVLEVFSAYERRSIAVNAIDLLLGAFPSLARRVTVLARHKSSMG